MIHYSSQQDWHDAENTVGLNSFNSLQTFFQLICFSWLGHRRVSSILPNIFLIFGIITTLGYNTKVIIKGWILRWTPPVSVTLYRNQRICLTSTQCNHQQLRPDSGCCHNSRHCTRQLTRRVKTTSNNINRSFLCLRSFKQTCLQPFQDLRKQNSTEVYFSTLTFQ